jgi:hypothetical protein
MVDKLFRNFLFIVSVSINSWINSGYAYHRCTYSILIYDTKISQQLFAILSKKIKLATVNDKLSSEDGLCAEIRTLAA